MAHTHAIIDSDKNFIIDPITRTISNNSDKVKLIQFDHNSERFTFQCPRMIEGHDMSQCTSVRVQYNNVNKRTKETSAGVYVVDDLTVSSNDPSAVVFSWLISRNATKYVGTLSFLIEFVCVEDDAVTDYAWHTDIYKYITVAAGMDNGEVIEEKYPDVLEQWKNEIISEIPTTTPHPVTKIESLDKSNIKTLRGLEDGPYVLSGYFTPYTGSDSTLIFDPPAIVSISSTDSATHVQILEPYNNQIQHLAITDTTCETTYIPLNDITKSASEIGDLSTLTTTAKDTLVDAINEAASDITFTVDAYVGMEKTDITVDKTPAEIYEAYTKGLIVTLNLRSDTQGLFLRNVNLKLSCIDKYDDKYQIVFSNLVKGNTPTSYALKWTGAKWKYERDFIADYDYLEQEYAKCYYGTDSAGKILGINSYGIVAAMDAAGSVIPSVTASDNGKVLQVVNGAWTAVTSSGGSGGSITAIEF